MIDNEILTSFKEVATKYIGNTNSLHKLGTDAKRLENAATKQIYDILNIENKEMIYVSDRCEANSLAIIGFLEKYRGKNKKIIVDACCDKSIIDALNYYKKDQFHIEVLEENILKSLDVMLDDSVVLVCLNNNCDIVAINKLIKKYKMCNLLVDMTDNFDIGFDFNLADFIIFDAKSVNAIRGIGCLLKKKTVVLEPIFHGGKSTTIYRSGTPALPFIVSLSKAIKILYNKNLVGYNIND